MAKREPPGEADKLRKEWMVYHGEVERVKRKYDELCAEEIKAIPKPAIEKGRLERLAHLAKYSITIVRKGDLEDEQALAMLGLKRDDIEDGLAELQCNVRGGMTSRAAGPP
jgi:hypothetical protein